MDAEIIVGAVMASGLVGWTTALQRRINMMGQCEAKTRERIARLEAKSDAIFDRLDRIERKLDNLLRGKA